MSTTDKYRSLKIEGTWKDRLDYVLSLPDKSEMEKYLETSSCHDDLQMLIILSKSTKNERILFRLSKTDSLPIRQRVFAAKGWLKVQKDEEKIYSYLVEMMTKKNIPRLFKNEILKDLHLHHSLKKSSSFFYRLVSHLTETYHHHQFNLDAYLVPFCSKDQILDILSRWSIQRFEQIDSASLFRAKLIFYQPAIVLHLIQCDLLEKRRNPEGVCQYFQENYQLFLSCAQKDPKAICRLVIDYLHPTENHQRLLPYFIFVKQKYFFKKAPDEMIELISLIGTHEPGKIQYQTVWHRKGSDLEGFIFPRSFSIDHYIRLFTVLYETCRWSSSHTMQLFQYLLRNSHGHFGLSSIRKRRIWLFDIVIQQRIGHEIFLEKLLTEGDETTLKLFVEYPELTTPLSIHLIAQHELNRSLSTKQHLLLLRYQLMTDELFSRFRTLCSQTNVNKQQRQQNYILFLHCALTNNEEHVQNVLQYLFERFTHAPLPMIEHFIRSLMELNNRFHLEILPKNFLIVRAIIELALKHLQRSINTRQIIVEYGLFLLQRVEFHPNQEQREEIQEFACQIIKRCFTIDPIDGFYLLPLSESYRMTRHLLADILISEVFPTFLSKYLIDDLNDMLNYVFGKPWKVPQLDAFLESFFTEYLPASTKLQSIFQVSRHSSMFTSYLKVRSTRLKRVHQLINKFDQVFFLSNIVQQVVLRSGQYRILIDQYLDGEKRSNVTFPGFHIEVLNTSFYYLTGRQQEHITKIILHDFIHAKDVSNSNKLKSLHVLGRMTHTYEQSLPWFFLKQTFPTAMKNHTRRTVQPLDDLIICVPVNFHLTSENLLEQFHLLKNKLNAASAKYVSDAMLIISRRISDDDFLKHYLELVHDESFQKLGITANKEIFRLLIEFTKNSSLITAVIKPFWESRPHQDVRACLILTLLHFTDKVQSNEEKTVVWDILEQATTDTYLPVIQSLFSGLRGNSRWPLHRLRNCSNSIYPTFVNRIQYRILDHPTSLEARVWAWQNIDYKYCHSEEFIRKGKDLLLQFDQNGNSLWEIAFQKICLLDNIVDIIKQLMSCRDDIDAKYNAINHYQDLPVYHRIHSILKILIQRMDQFDPETKLTFRSLPSMILQFDETFAVLIGTLSIRIAADKDDLRSMLMLLEKNLSKHYFERVLIQLADVLADSRSSSFLQQYTINEKLNFARWFIQDEDQGLFVFALLKKQIFNAKDADREQCQTLLRQLRQSDNLLLRQQALEYVVPWKHKKENLRRKPHPARIKKDSSQQETIDLNIFNISHE